MFQTSKRRPLLLFFVPIGSFLNQPLRVRVHSKSTACLILLSLFTCQISRRSQSFFYAPESILSTTDFVVSVFAYISNKTRHSLFFNLFRKEINLAGTSPTQPTMPSHTTTLVSAVLFSYLNLVSAKTDLTGCTTTDVSSPAGASVAWYVPGTGELCDFLDCGGGAGAPRYDVPGCPLYTGTSTYSPSYLAGYAATAIATAAASGSSSAAAQVTTTSSAVVSSSVAITSSASFDTTVYGSSATVINSNAPAICALQASSDPNCGVSWSTTTYSTSTSTSTYTGPNASSVAPYTSSGAAESGSPSVASGSGSSSGSASQSKQSSQASGSSKITTAAGSGTASSSETASSTYSGAAAGMTGVVGGLGFIAAALGAVAAL